MCMKYGFFFICTLLIFVLTNCNDSREIGGVWGEASGKSGKDFFKPEKIEKYENRPKEGKRVTFLITHKNIDLSNYDILIEGEERYGNYYYYGPYQKEVTVYMPSDKNENFCVNLTFRIINKETDSLYYFTSDFNYYIFKTDKIKVKLLPDCHYLYLDMQSCYKLTGCPSADVDFHIKYLEYWLKMLLL